MWKGCLETSFVKKAAQGEIPEVSSFLYQIIPLCIILRSHLLFYLVPCSPASFPLRAPFPLLSQASAPKLHT